MMTDDNKIVGRKPWIVWNRRFLTRPDGIQGYAVHNRLLYTSQLEPWPLTKVYPENYLPGYVEEQVAPPSILGISLASEENGEAGEVGVTGHANVVYLFIPCNKRDEAGEWRYWHYVASPGPGTGSIPTIELEVNDSCLYVDVYRTRERDDDGGENENEFYYIGRYQKGLVHRTTATYEVSPYPSDPPNLTELSEDVDFLYFDSRGDTFTDLVGWKVVFDTSQGHTVEVGTEYEISAESVAGELIRLNITPDPHWDYDHLTRYEKLEFKYPDDLYNEDLWTPSVFRLIPDDVFYEDKVIVVDETNILQDGENLPTTGTLQRHRNVHSIWRGVSDFTSIFDGPTLLNFLRGNGYKPFGARTVLNDAGVFMWGDVAWATKEPQVCHLTEDTANSLKLGFQYEYDTPTGPAYGPVLIVDAPDKINVEYQGETALRIFVYDPAYHATNFYLYERITANEIGRYKSGLIEDDQILAFDYAAYDQDILGNSKVFASYSDYQIQAYIYEPNKVLMSDQNRPWEITFNQTETPDSKPVMALLHARLAEAEGVRGYNFYIASHEGIFVCQRNGFDVFRDTVTNAFGITPDYRQEAFHWSNFVSLTRDGIVFIGSDRRMHYLTGRQLTLLDENVRDLFHNIGDLAYDAIRDELWVLTTTGTWIYSFIYNEWVANYEFIFDERDVVFNYPGVGIIMNTNSDDEEENDTAYIMNERGPRLAPKVVTNYVLDGPDRPLVDTVRVDYATHYENPAATITNGTDLELTGVGEFFRPEDVGGRIYFLDPEGNPAKATIESYTDKYNVTIEDTGLSADPYEAGPVRWVPLLEVTHETRFPQSSQEYSMFAGRARYPMIRGAGHRFSLEHFTQLREIILTLKP